MIDHVEVRRGSYHDSVTLMLVSRDLLAVDGVVEASVVSATPLNVELVTGQGFTVPDDAGPNDLVIALRAESDDAVAAALGSVEVLLSPRRTREGGGAGAALPVSVTAASREHPAGNLAVLSVPRQSLGYEIASSIAHGLNVFCFSDGLSIEEERAYKSWAVTRGLLLMGPDCGTAIVDGYGLGFANVVRPGPVGIVGASGTGIQEVCCLLHRAGVGVSQVLGVGGRDLKAEVGGIMTVEAVRRLGVDPATQSLVVISKPPDPGVALRVAAAAAASELPAVLCLLGVSDLHELAGLPVMPTLEGAARWAVERHGGVWPGDGAGEGWDGRVRAGRLRGLFSGGTLAYEAMTTLSPALAPILSNTPLRKEWHLGDMGWHEGDIVIDFGEDELTAGRAHPMIDPSLRLSRFDTDAADREVGVILLDVVLGHGAHADPAAELTGRMRDALGARPDDLAVVVCVCGTDLDPQDADRQAAALRAAGAVTTFSAASAARMALRILGKDRP